MLARAFAKAPTHPQLLASYIRLLNFEVRASYYTPTAHLLLHTYCAPATTHLLAPCMLLYCCFTAAVLLLYCRFTCRCRRVRAGEACCFTALLLLYCCFTAALPAGVGECARAKHAASCAGGCSETRMLTYADVCIRQHTSAHVCCFMRWWLLRNTYADVC